MKHKHALLVTLFTALAVSMEADPEGKGMTTSQLRRSFEKVHPNEGCPTTTQIKRAAEKVLVVGWYEGTECCYISKLMGAQQEVKSLKRKLQETELRMEVMQKEIRKLDKAARRSLLKLVG